MLNAELKAGNVSVFRFSIQHSAFSIGLRLVSVDNAGVLVTMPATIFLERKRNV